MENFANNYMTVETWLMIFFGCILAMVLIIYLVFSWAFKDKRKLKTKKREPAQLVIPSRTFMDISLDPSGTLDDTFSSVKNQIGYVMHKLAVEGSLKILVTTSAFGGCVSHHLIHLLRELSRTTTRIDLLEDVEQLNLSQAVNSIRGHGVRIDKTYLITDSILISEIADYDIIITAHSGIRSTYELIHGVVHELAMKER